MIVYFALLSDASEKEKLAILYEKYQKKMFFVAYSLLGDSFAAEDAVHEAFIAVARNIKKLGDQNSPETEAYLCRAAKTRALNIYQAKMKERERAVYIEDESDIPFEEPDFDRIIAASEISAIADGINKLPEKYRTVIILRYLDEMKPNRIAANLGLNPETVKKRLVRGKVMLKEILEEVQK